VEIVISQGQIVSNLHKTGKMASKSEKNRQNYQQNWEKNWNFHIVSIDTASLTAQGSFLITLILIRILTSAANELIYTKYF